MSERGSILLIDDDIGTCETIGSVLELRGHSVLTATRARSALEILTARSVDAAILDLQLPDVSGLVLLQAIKTSSPTTEVTTKSSGIGLGLSLTTGRGKAMTKGVES